MGQSHLEWEVRTPFDEALDDVLERGLAATMAAIPHMESIDQLIGSAILMGLDMGIVIASEDRATAAAIQQTLLARAAFTSEDWADRVAVFARLRALTPR